jgi:urease accessory protein
MYGAQVCIVTMGFGRSHTTMSGSTCTLPMSLMDPAKPSSREAGCAVLQVEQVFRESAVTAAFATSPMKLLAPRSRGPSAWVCTSSFGGGLVAGDRTRLEVRVGPGARCVIGTQASTKVYRNPDGLPCSHTTLATLESGSLLAFLPDPVQPFAGSVYSQRQKFQLAPGASLVLLDWFSSGRAACGERWAFTRFQTRNDVFVAGERSFVESTVLEDAGDPSGSTHRTGRFNCLALLLLVGPQVRSLAGRMLEGMASRPVTTRASLVCSASPIRDGVVLRAGGETVEQVAREIHTHLRSLAEVLGGDPWERKY